MAYTPWLPSVSRPLLTALLVGTALSMPVMAQIPTQPTSTVAPANGLLVAPNYILGPGDEVGVTVYDYEEMTVQKVVLSDGTILMPLINSVMVAGLTPDQVAIRLEQELNQYLVNPDVSVTLLALRPVEVNVTGEVQRPGPVRLRGLINAQANGSQNEQVIPTLSTALVQAGGVTRYGDLRNILLRRYDPNRGNTEPVVVNLWDAISTGNLAPDLVLQDGDSIYVPRLTSGELDQRLIARSSLAPETVRVRVVGEVVNPGEVAVPPNSSVSSAVAIAGGPTSDAELDEVVFVRMNESGEVERYDLDLRNLMDEFQVQEGDVVIVPKNGGLNLLDLAARIINPFGGAVNILDRLFN